MHDVGGEREEPDVMHDREGGRHIARRKGPLLATGNLAHSLHAPLDILKHMLEDVCSIIEP